MGIINNIESGVITLSNLGDINLSQYTDAEKIQMIDICEKKIAFWNTNQMALKISINSLD